jgi:cyclopropane fatty-acyl-phospholipid synthase-like methyltransferase
MDAPRVSTIDELLGLLDSLLDDRGPAWWTDFYSDPRRRCPFFTADPNEDLHALVESTTIRPPMHVLELGCGNGRNANFLSSRGFDVDAVDFSSSSIAQAHAAASSLASTARFHCRSIFDFRCDAAHYDLVYDSGCFHHIAPHRRPGYLDILSHALRPGGLFGLACFATGDGSPTLSDREAYEGQSTHGGFSFTEEDLRQIFALRFEILSLRRMRELPEDSGLFGKSFLWAGIFRKVP